MRGRGEERRNVVKGGEGSRKGCGKAVKRSRKGMELLQTVKRDTRQEKRYSARCSLSFLTSTSSRLISSSVLTSLRELDLDRNSIVCFARLMSRAAKKLRIGITPNHL